MHDFRYSVSVWNQQETMPLHLGEVVVESGGVYTIAIYPDWSREFTNSGNLVRPALNSLN